jgi:GT2 family glycosyltransferase
MFVSLIMEILPRRPRMTTPRVLVVLPTMGQRLVFLEQALRSISEQGPLARCVVVSPPSGEVEKLAKKYGAQWREDPAFGIAAAVNVGLRAREGEEFYAWLGDDDLFRPGALKTLTDLLDAHKEAVLASGACDYILDSGKVIAVNQAGALGRFLLPWGPDLIPHPGTVVRLDDLEAIGGFDESLRFTLDLDAFLKLRRRGKFVFTKDVVSAFRWHPDSLTVSDRWGSSQEAMTVKVRHLPSLLRPIAWVWNYPVAWASAVAAWLLVRRARLLARSG